jgi:hypothetical protein
MRFDRGANAGVHLARASMRKHLLLEARQSGQDFSAALECNLGFFRFAVYMTYSFLPKFSGAGFAPNCG